MKNLTINIDIPDSATPLTWGQVRSLLAVTTPVDDNLEVGVLSAPIWRSLAGVQLAVTVTEK